MPKKLFVLYTPKTRPSGRALANKLRSYNENCTIEQGLSDRLGWRIQTGAQPDVVVNVGCAYALPYEYNGVVLNTPAAIAHGSNKRRARMTFEKEDIPAPKLWTSGAIPRDVYPLVGRTTTHSKGKGFWYCENHVEAARAHAQGATHFMKFVADTREFRVHVVTHDKDKHEEQDYVSMKISEKLYEAPNKNDADDIIKNRSHGWVFKAPHEIPRQNLENLRTVAKKTVSKIGLHWGAVDVMMDPQGNIFVLEVNSSPCLTDEHANTCEKYAEWVLNLADIRKKDYQPKPIAPEVKAKPVLIYNPQPKPAKQAVVNDHNVKLVRNMFARLGI